MVMAKKERSELRGRKKSDEAAENETDSTTSPAGGVSETIVVDGQTYVLTFNDEFDGNTAAYWQGYGKGGVWATSYSPHLENARSNSANGELQYYADPSMTGLPDPFTVSHGVMTIHASPLSADQIVMAGGMDFTSGMMSTEMSFSMQGGYLEISADIPDQTGFWSAFWLLPTDGDWSAEIDVFEYLGGAQDAVFTNLWTDGQPDEMIWADSGAGDGFHTYGLFWDDDVIRWSIDGVTIRETANTVQEDMYLIFNLAVGGWAGDPDATTDFSDGLSVDYIRVYELDSDPDRNPAIDDGGFVASDLHGGTDGNDLINGSDWSDQIDAAAGHDTIYADIGDDLVFAGSGDDFLFGNTGDDTLSGQDGQDELVGGLGADVLQGGAGTDHLWGGIYAADGSQDRFVFESGCGIDYVHDFETGLDILDLSGFEADWMSIWNAVSDLGWATQVDLASIGGDADDCIYLVGTESATLSAEDFGFGLVA